MKLIDKERFLQYKKSDTLVIWGSGSSIKDLKKEDFDYLNQFDSISTTMFSKSKIQTTFYIIGEIIFNYYRAKAGNQECNGKLLYKLYEEAGDHPIEYVKTFKDYPNSCFIIWADKWTLNKEHFTELDKLENDYILVKQYGHDPELNSSRLNFDENTGPNNKFIDKKLYNKKLLLEDKIWLHQWKGINAPIYFAKCMEYKKVIFVGVDLTAGPNSYGYDRKKFVKTIASKMHPGHANCSVHPCKDLLFKLVKYLKDDIDFSTYTPSLLEEIIPVDINKDNVIVSIATTPTRINKIEKTIESINNQNPDIIYLNIPYVCKKEGKEYIIPDFLKKYKKLVINRLNYDLGPSNKLIPVLDIYKNGSVKKIITLDDDIILEKNSLNTLISLLNEKNKIVANHTWSLSSYINKIKYESETEKIIFARKYLSDFPDKDIMVSQTKICGFMSDVLKPNTIEDLINEKYPFHYYLGNDVFFGILMKNFKPLITKINRKECDYGSLGDALCKSSTPYNYINLIYDYCKNVI